MGFPHIRDQAVDLVVYWSRRTALPAICLINWLGISRSKFYHWHARYGQGNHHNGDIPRDFWLQDWKKKVIINFYLEHPAEGYRRLTFMMINADVAAVSPSSGLRVLHEAGLLRRWKL